MQQHYSNFHLQPDDKRLLVIQKCTRFYAHVCMTYAYIHDESEAKNTTSHSEWGWLRHVLADQSDENRYSGGALQPWKGWDNWRSNPK